MAVNGTAPTISSSRCAMTSNQFADDMERPRITVIGSNVTTVQCVSRYCLNQGAEVFPYYGTPKEEEVALFAPDFFVLCLPVPEDFRSQITQPYVLWSEQLMHIGIPLVYTAEELEVRLKEVLHS